MIDITQLEPRAQLVEIMTRIYNKKLTTPSGGNLSMKDAEGNVWVTPSQIDKGKLTVDDMVQLVNGKPAPHKHKPTSEFPFHLKIYEANPYIQAVTHAHPTAMVAYGAVHKTPKFNNIPEITKYCNNVGYTDYAIPGSDDLGINVQKAFLAGHDVAIMENHGVIATEDNIVKAFHKMEAIEHMANIYLDAKKIGKVQELTKHERQAYAAKADFPSAKLLVSVADYADQAAELIDYMKRCYERGLMSAVLGAMSIRVDTDTFLISPANVDITYLEMSDLVVVHKGQQEAGKVANPYVDIHQAVYTQHPELNSVATAQPQAIMAFAISDTIFDSRTIPESYIFLKTIPSLDFTSRYQQPETVAKAIGNKSPNAIVKNDCFVVTGSNPFQVFDRLEVAEFTARSIIDSKQLGEIVPMKDKDIQEIIRVYLS